MTIRKQIIALSLPAIAANITTPLLGLIDTAIVGHLGSAVYIGAVALGSSVFNMLYWLFGFLRAGTSGLTAQAYGATTATHSSQPTMSSAGRGTPATDTILYRALTIALIVGLLIILLRQPLGSAVIALMDADDATYPVAMLYYRWATLGAPAVMCGFVLSGWMLGMQSSQGILWMSLITNIVNIIVSLTLVFGFGLGVRGIAVGTVSAQWVGTVYGLWYACRKYGPGRIQWTAIIDTRQLLRFFSINTDIFLRTLCLVAVTMWFTRSGAAQGVDMLACNALLMQLFLFFSYFMDGFAYAGEALAGRFHGAGDKQSLRTTVSQLLRIGLLMSLLFTALYFFAGEAILHVLTDVDSVLDVARDYLPWAVTVPLTGMTAFIFDGIFIGITRTRLMLIIMFAAMLVFFGLYFICQPSMGNHGLWLAFTAYLLTRGLGQLIAFRHQDQ